MDDGHLIEPGRGSSAISRLTAYCSEGRQEGDFRRRFVVIAAAIFASFRTARHVKIKAAPRIAPGLPRWQ
jgi:hypothetical protein